MGNVTQLVVGRKFPGRIIFDGEMLGGIFYGEIVVFWGRSFMCPREIIFGGWVGMQDYESMFRGYNLGPLYTHTQTASTWLYMGSSAC